MILRSITALSIVAISASAGSAQTELNMDDFMVNCVSSVDQSDVTLVRSGGSNKGYITTSELKGEADIYPGIGNITFLLLKDKEVVTFVVDYNSMSYNMMIKGAEQKYDKGTCSAS